MLRDNEIKPVRKLHSTHTLYTESVYDSNNLDDKAPIVVFLLKPAISTLANVTEHSTANGTYRNSNSINRKSKTFGFHRHRFTSLEAKEQEHLSENSERPIEESVSLC